MTMHDTTTGLARPGISKVVLAACLVLTGCSGSGTPADDATAAVEAMAPADSTPAAGDDGSAGSEPTASGQAGAGGEATVAGDGTDQDVGGDGELTLEDDDGTVSLGTDLPADFPAEVPLIDGEVVSAVKVDNEDAFGWVVQVLNEDADAHDRAVEGVTGAGFAPAEGVPEVSGGAVTAAILVNEDWQVVVGSLEGQGIVSYTVTALDR